MTIRYIRPVRLTHIEKSKIARDAVRVAAMQSDACSIMIRYVDRSTPQEWKLFEHYLDSAREELKKRTDAAARAKLFEDMHE